MTTTTLYCMKIRLFLVDTEYRNLNEHLTKTKIPLQPNYDYLSLQNTENIRPTCTIKR